MKFEIKENSLMNGFQSIDDTLDKAQFVKHRSTEIGFDTNNSVEKAFKKIEEEFNELKAEVELYLKDNSIDITNLKKEMGDLLFSTNGLANQLGFKTKDCLNMTIEKFVFRTCYVEDKLRENGQDFSTGDIKQMCEWWKEAKKYM